MNKKSLKPALDVPEQITKLENRGLIIDDIDKAKLILHNTNYYVFTGYLHHYKDKENDAYTKKFTFENIWMIYNFDEDFKSILLSMISYIEISLKTRIAYELALEYKDNPCMYLDKDFFKAKEDHDNFISQFNAAVYRDRHVPFVKHHIENYDSKFPIWVAVELMTLGNLQHLFKNLPAAIRKRIATQYSVKPLVLDSWLNNLRITRNMIAHNRRLYNVNWNIIPKNIDGIIENKYVNTKVFMQLIMIKNMFPYSDIWTRKIKQLEQTLNEFNNIVELEALGFSDNWKELLLK